LPTKEQTENSSAVSEKDCEIIHLSPREVFTVAFAMPNGRAGEFMNLVEKEFGKSVTTRNWNTVIKILALAGIE